MQRAEGWLVHTNVSGSFSRACELWDAMYEGVRESGSGLLSEEGKQIWNETDSWLRPRRMR